MKKFVIVLIVSCIIFMYGCSNGSAQFIDKIHDTINQIRIISNDIDDYINSEASSKLLGIEKGTNSERQIVEYIPSSSNDNSDDESGTGYNGSTFTSGDSIDESDLELYKYSNNPFLQNETTKYLIAVLDSKVNSLQSYCSIISDKNIALTNTQKNTITDICDNLSNTSKKILSNKNDINKELNLISNSKENVSSMYNNYNSICNDILLRNSYITSICYGIDNLYQLLYTCNSVIDDNNNKTNNSSYNIDSYKNSIKQNKTTVKQNQYESNNYNNSNYNQNYGYGNGRTNPYYSYGYAGRYGGMFGNYPYSPYSNYNPYMPNIDTYGSFKNIDTYKSVDQINDDNNDNKNNDDNNNDDNNNEDNNNEDNKNKEEDKKNINNENFTYPNVLQTNSSFMRNINSNLHIVKDKKPPKIEKLEQTINLI